ncbi:MAG: hypothetical protein Q6364_06830 [Candidatus Hermodarchaeota archaeon]|nr:hypothetical protein [Candidatus Hermodarchaeota archaeon]
MRTFRNSSFIFLMKTLTAFIILSFIYHLLTVLIPFPLFVYCNFYPCPDIRQIAMVYHTLDSQLFLLTLSGAFRGALLGIPSAVVLTRLPERPQHLQLRCLLLGVLIGAGIGAFLLPFPIRWQLWLLISPSLSGNLGPYVLLDTNYFFNLTTLMLLAIFQGINTKSKGTTPMAYRFGCRN